MKKPVLDLTRISKYMRLILRHKPEAIGIELDAHGWANVDALLAGIGRKYAIDRGVLEEIVRTDGKQRYSFNADRTMIRANQGHSIPMWSFPQPNRRKHCSTGLLNGLLLPSRHRGCAQRAACMCISPAMRKQRKRWAAGMGSRSSTRWRPEKCTGMGISFTCLPMACG